MFKLDCMPENAMNSAGLKRLADRNVACVVCGGRSRSRNYGVRSCDNCKAFFRRAFLNGLIDTCHRKERCTIGKDVPKLCRSCRLRKCLSAGMVPYVVYKERQRAETIRDTRRRSESAETGPAIDLLTGPLVEPNSYRRCDCLEEKRPLKCFVNFNEAFFEPTMITPTAKSMASAQDVLQDWRRCFVLFADWLGALPELRVFSGSDQMVIAKARFEMFHWWMCGNWTVRSGCGGICYSNGSYFPREKRFQCLPDRGSCELMLDTLVTSLIDLQLDDIERSTTTALIVFYDVLPKLSASGQATIRDVNSQGRRALHQHIALSKHLGPALTTLRVARIMLLIPALMVNRSFTMPGSYFEFGEVWIYRIHFNFSTTEHHRRRRVIPLINQVAATEDKPSLRGLVPCGFNYGGN